MKAPPPLAPRRLALLLSALVLSAALVPSVTAQEEPLVARSIGDAAAQVGADRAVWFSRPVWADKPTGQGVRVAVVDTGMDPAHPDLARHGSTMLWRDLVHGRTQPYDDNGHGTHIAGIIAAHGSTRWDLSHFYFPFGMRGIAPDVTLLVAKAMDAGGEGTDETVSRAIRWSVDPDGDGDPADGADIINLSVGIERPIRDGPVTARVAAGTQTKEAIRDAVAAGVIVVVSAGNDGRTDGVSEPGDMAEVISVGATTGEDAVADFSNHDTGKPDLVAPGVIVSTYPLGLDGRHAFDRVADGYTGMAGTSMAAPLVTGTLALMLGADPGLVPAGPGDRTDDVLRVKAVLTGSADPLADRGSGHGRLDADEAFAAVDPGTDRLAWWFPPFLVAVAASAGLAVALWVRRRRRERAREPAPFEPWDE